MELPPLELPPPPQRRRSETEEIRLAELGLQRSRPSNQRLQGLSFSQCLLMALSVCTTGILAYHYGRPTLAQSRLLLKPPLKAEPVQIQAGPELVRINAQLQDSQRQRYELETQLKLTNQRLENLQKLLQQEHTQFESALQAITNAPKVKGNDDLAAQVNAVAMHFAAIQSQHSTLETRLRTFDDQLTDITTQVSALKSTASPLAQVGDLSGVSPTSRELIILKERNKLTLHADEAIATGRASPIRALWQAARDPDLDIVKHGSMAEILRVQNHFSRFTVLPPDYRLPLKGHTVQSDTELSPEALITFLADEQQPASARTRAARLLATHRTPTVAEALVLAMQRDPEIDVVKEAQFALKKAFRMEAALFDSEYASTWLKKEKAQISAP
jgi:chaperonin cofactor prefoldin